MNNQQEKTLLPGSLRLQLKKQAHHLKPVIQIGKKGISDALLKEIDGALLAHELIKIQLPKEYRALEEDLPRILQETRSHHIDTIGNVVILYRKIETT
ncbi:MAG TPA: YhbY family RNA-binding protein [Myxococcota bacterium]|nr:YhbY family RNA-binding protein [Myxococcota bacterium]